MFKNIKKYFTKSKNKSPKPFYTTSMVSFQDMKLQNIVLEVRSNGNDTLLHILEKKNNTEFILNDEQCVLFSAILNEYARNGELTQLAHMLKGDE